MCLIHHEKNVRNKWVRIVRKNVTLERELETSELKGTNEPLPTGSSNLSLQTAKRRQRGTCHCCLETQLLPGVLGWGPARFLSLL